jgi:hypothetical protein
VLYGAGAPRVAAILGIDRADARVALDRWYATYPEIARLKAQLSRQIHRRGYIETIGGRRHYAERANHMTVNYLVQGSAADLFKAAIAELHAAGCPLILFVHDELVAEVDEDQAEPAAALLEAILPQSMERNGACVDGLVAEAAIHKRWSDSSNRSTRLGWSDDRDPADAAERARRVERTLDWVARELLAQELDADAARVPATVPSRRDGDRLNGVGDEPSPRR